MIRILLALSISFSSVTIFAEESFTGACIDLKAFAELAARKISGDTERSQGVIVFQDAAYSVDLQPSFDGASLFFISQPKYTVDKLNYNMAIRLSLHSGKIVPVLLRIEDGSRVVGFVDQVMVSLGKKSVTEIGKVSRDLHRILGDGFRISEELSGIGILLIHNENERVRDLVWAVTTARDFFKSEKREASVSLNNEIYRTPFEFGKAQDLSEQKISDLDRLRDVTRQKLNEGVHFATLQSTIPEPLKAFCPFK